MVENAATCLRRCLRMWFFIERVPRLPRHIEDRDVLQVRRRTPSEVPLPITVLKA